MMLSKKMSSRTTAMLSESIPYPKLDLEAIQNPIPTILASNEFNAADRYFVQSQFAKRSLVAARAHVVLYTLIRNQRPTNVVEIGTYRGGTTETMARAVHANGAGTVHTIGPFDAESFLPIYDRWPNELKQTTCFYPVDSMAFYMEMERQSIRPDLVFVDGNHDYEFALFDILCAARRLTPGGFIVVDDASQAGPYFAARDFTTRNPDWIDCSGSGMGPRDLTKAFDRARAHVPDSDLIILRAPRVHCVSDDRPRTFGELIWHTREVQGITLSTDGRNEPGTLHVQCILRGFGGTCSPAQVIAAGSSPIEPGMERVEIKFGPPGAVEPIYDRYTIETWLIWIGQGSLRLVQPPLPF
jgi:predicted O-methyltransferase YrrM